MIDSKTKKVRAKELVKMTKDRRLFKLNNLATATKFKKNITYWEKLTCVGYNPQHKRLEAVVNVNQNSGYNGDLCSKGSTEYIRFFIDFKDGNGFQDMGYKSFKVANISDSPPGPQHPLSYMSYLFIDDKKYKKFINCDKAVIPTVRAVLSWNSIPSTNPNAIPYYGNRLDADIQLAKKDKVFPFELAEILDYPQLVKMIEPQVELKLKTQKPTTALEILKLNEKSDVPTERTFYSTIGSKINTSIDFSKATSSFDIESLGDLQIDLSKYLDLFDDLKEAEANTDFEELTCVGLHSETDRLGAVIHIKKQSGFNGNLCSNGSMEHVAFWADWDNNGNFDEHLGTVSLNVHDIENIPTDGLFYNVMLPLDVTKRLKSCKRPNIVRIRAVLSWESLPSTTNPNKLNTWGNYKDALVQLRPKRQTGKGIYSAIHEVGNVEKDKIDPTNYLYNYQATAPTYNNNRPWGGSILFDGVIDRNGSTETIKYRILYKKLSEPVSAYQPVSTSETFRLDDLSDLNPPYNDPQSDPDGWYVYKQDPANHIYNVNNKLATWVTNSTHNGPYSIRFVYVEGTGSEVIADEFTIMINNEPMTISPTANVSVDTAFDIDLVIDGGDCHSYDPGEIINGHLRATHNYFALWSLNLQPTSHTNGANPSPASKNYSLLTPTGDSNSVWTLDTTGMDSCGYTISLGARTRVIRNSSTNLPLYTPKAVGFAIK